VDTLQVDTVQVDTLQVDTVLTDFSAQAPNCVDQNSFDGTPT